MNTHVVFSNQDPTLNQTQDNNNTNQGFFTTYSGDSPTNILQDQKNISDLSCYIQSSWSMHNKKES